MGLILLSRYPVAVSPLALSLRRRWPLLLEKFDIYRRNGP